MAVTISPGSAARVDLTGAMYGFMTRNSNQFAGCTILPGFQTPVRDYRFMRIPGSELTRREKTKRAAGADTSRSNHKRIEVSGTIAEYAHEELVDPSNTAGYVTTATQETVAAERALGIALRDLEGDIASALFNTTTFPLSGTTGHTASVVWSTSATADPLLDIHLGVDAIATKTGMIANTLVITGRGLRHASRTAQLVNRIAYTNPAVNSGQLPSSTLAQLFGVDRVVVVDGIYNNVAEGGTDAFTRLWDANYAFLCVTNPGPDIEMPQLGRLMQWDYDPSPGTDSVRTENVDGVDVFIEEYSEPRKASKVIRARKFASPQICDTNCGYLIKIT
jgi:hypothetical protein